MSSTTPVSAARAPATLLPSRLQGRVRWLLKGYWLLAFTATHLPEIPLEYEPTTAPLDKLVHFSLYAGLAFLLALSEAPRWWTTRSDALAPALRAATVLAIIWLYGLCDEVSQPWFGRDKDWADWVADACGALAGLLCLGLVELLVRRWRSRRPGAPRAA